MQTGLKNTGAPRIIQRIVLFRNLTCVRERLQQTMDLPVLPKTVSTEPMKRPMSPCMSICALDATGHCAGCLRTREEIAGWIRMSPEEQWALLKVLDERRVARS